MQFRIQFLDGSAIVIGELTAAARSPAGALQLVVADDWPLEAVSIRVLDAAEREVHSAIRGDAGKIGLGSDAHTGEGVLAAGRFGRRSK